MTILFLPASRLTERDPITMPGSFLRPADLDLMTLLFLPEIGSGDRDPMTIPGPTPSPDLLGMGIAATVIAKAKKTARDSFIGVIR